MGVYGGKRSDAVHDPRAEEPPTLRRFRGLNNVADPMRGTGVAAEEPWEWQSIADNVDGTDSLGIELRAGYQQFLAAAITGSYSTVDFSRLYIIAGGLLKRVYPSGQTETLHSGLSGAAHWSEINDVVYLSCGADKLQIEQDNTVKTWGVPTPAQPVVSAASGSLSAGVYQVAITYTDADGREGGACQAIEITLAAGSGITVSAIPQLHAANVYLTDADGAVFYLAARTAGSAVTLTIPAAGVELTTQFLDAPPASGGHVAFFAAAAFLAEYIPEIDQTVVWRSRPLAYHLFNLDSDYFVVPGEVTQMHGAAAGLIVTTQSRVFAYDGERLAQLAPYGAPPGQHAEAGADEKIYFWTKRGLCRAFPFQNMTESALSVAPGVQAGGGIVESNGYRKFVAVIQQGGSAHNAR